MFSDSAAAEAFSASDNSDSASSLGRFSFVGECKESIEILASHQRFGQRAIVSADGGFGRISLE